MDRQAVGPGAFCQEAVLAPGPACARDQHLADPRDLPARAVVAALREPLARLALAAVRVQTLARVQVRGLGRVPGREDRARQ